MQVTLEKQKNTLEKQKNTLEKQKNVENAQYETEKCLGKTCRKMLWRTPEFRD